MRRPAVPELKNPGYFDHVKFGGGLDLETPTWEVSPGKLREAQNYEIGVNGGYLDIVGYERFDGNPAPSAASYSTIDVTISGSISVGDTVTGATSSATGVVIAVVTSGTPDYLVLTKVTGTFQDAENLTVSAVVQGVTASVATTSGATTPSLDAQYLNLAADEYRGDIAAVPGSGSILGVYLYGGEVYAFRNAADGLSAALYKSSSSGWTAVALGRELDFTSGGTYEIAEGDTITGATSGATAVVTRVVDDGSGTWAAGTAAGRLIFASQTGTFVSENLNVGANLNVATIAGNSSAITLQPSGRYEFVTTNFGGTAGEDRVYGVDGVNRGFEFDGTVFVPIDTGMASDAPTHVVAHKNHLFFSFGGSVQHSGIGTPYIWSPLFGAGELATGQSVTGFQVEPGAEGNASLSIFNRNNIYILYGTSSADWNLVSYRNELGAYAYSIQQLGYTMFLDDRGLTSLRTAQEFGNFAHSTFSTHIQRFLNEKRGNTTASCIVRDKNQYRIFFSDSYGLYVTMEGNKVSGLMPVLFSNPVKCITSQEASDGTEKIYFGSDNGYVYQMDRGTSFDGAAIAGYLVFHYHFSGRLRFLKKYLEVTLEARGNGYAEFDLAYELGYNSTDIPQATAVTNELSFSTVQWDSFVWDAFYWDGTTLGPSVSKINGTAENISLVIRKDSDYTNPVQISGAMFRIILRRQMR